MLRHMTLPQPMKNFHRAFVLTVCMIAGTTFADDFKSMVIPGDGGVMARPLPRVHNDQFMVIRNFTQDGPGGSRGFVTITNTPTGGPANVLAAAIIDSTNTTQGTLEVINSIVIAGPADVTVTCGAPMGMNCFISYKKDSN